MKKLEIFILTFILLLGFLVRLYRFDAPIADWHSWRQVDTSAVSRNFVKIGFDLLHPRFDDLSNVQSGIYFNPEGYRFVEFPIYNLFQAEAFLLFGRFTIEEWGRLISIFSSLLAATFIFLILKKHSNSLTGLLGAFFYSFLPFSIFWGRTVLPDQTAIMTTLGAIYFFDLYLENFNKKLFKKFLFFVLSVLFFASALLLKPFTVFFFLPAVFLAFKKFGLSLLKRKDLWVIGVASILPLLLWRVWMLQYPEGIPQSGWLFNGGDIRFKGAFFHWIFARRIGEQILGFWGLVIIFIGIVAKYKEKLFFFSFLISSLLYITIVARGNVHHNYYQILIIPTISIFLALGINFLINVPKQFFSRSVTIFALLVSILFMLAFSWHEVRDFYNVNSSIVTAGMAVDKLTPKDAKVIAPNEGDTTLLYYTKRKGWASFSKPIDGLKRDGADYLILFNPGAQGLKGDYKVVEETKDYIIFNIHKAPWQ